MKLAALMIWFALTSYFVPHATGAQTYYVDSTNGNDVNSGLSPKLAWKSLAKINATIFAAGDAILLKCGSIWQGQLLLKGEGTAQKPILLSSYGSGKKPVLNGNGKVDQVILLNQTEGWHIDNLEITNASNTVGNRTGILVRALGNTTQSHFQFTRLYIHDIMGDYSFETKGKNTGGIGIIGGQATKFDDILIADCEIGNINRVGIFTNLTSADQAKRGNRPFTRLVIRNNKIHHCAGDGVIVRYAYKPLIAHNLAYNNHNGPENLVKHGVALWCRSTDEAVFEYNEVYNTKGGMDGQAFDADLDSYRTVVQYNYSHDNEGGFMLIYGSSSETIVRYNLSVNDGKVGKHIFDFPKWVSPRGSGIFHNNTIILPVGSEAIIADEALETAKFYNNIFYNQGTGKLLNEGGYFNNNAYHGYAKSTITDAAAIFSYEFTKTLPNNPGTLKQSKIYAGIRSKRSKGKGVFINEFQYWLPDFGKHDFWGKPITSPRISVGAAR